MSSRIVLFLLLAACAVLGACDEQSVEPVDSSSIPWQSILRFNDVDATSWGEIWAADADHVFVVNTVDFFDDGITDVRVSQLSDGTWTDSSLPWTNAATAIWGSSPDDVYVAAGQLIHFDGQAWSALPMSAIRVTGSSHDKVFVANRDAILEFNGAEWDTLRTIDRYPGALAAAPDGSLFFKVPGGDIEIWTGSSWLPTNFPALEAANLFVLGANDAFARDPYDAYGVYHYDGHQWSRQSLHVEGTGAIGGTSASDVYAVGRSGLMLHYDGSDWVQLPRVTARSLYRISATPGGLAVLGDGRKVLWLDGSGTRTLRESDIEYTRFEMCAESSDHFMIASSNLIFRYDAGVWSEAPLTGSPGWVVALGGRAMNDVYASFNGGLIAHYDGSGWSWTDSVANTQYGFCVTPSGIVYSVGDGAVYRRGTEWEQIRTDAAWFYRIASDGGDGIVTVSRPAGRPEQVVLSHFQGSQWTELPPAPDFVYGLWSGPGLDLYFAGGRGIYHLRGNEFVRIPGADQGYYEHVFGTADGRVFGANPNGVVAVNGGFARLLGTRGVFGAVQAADGSIIADLDRELAAWKP